MTFYIRRAHALHLAVFVTLALGCEFDSARVPTNAHAGDMRVLDSLKQYTETVSWNSDGRVVGLSLASEKIDDNCVSQIAELLELTELALHGTKVTDKGLQQLVVLRKLNSLSLAWTPITDEALATVATLQELQVLDISHTAVTDECIPDLGKLAKLEHLFITGTKITGAGVLQLRELHPKCIVQQ